MGEKAFFGVTKASVGKIKKEVYRDFHLGSVAKKGKKRSKRR